jgi:hypothetical protein
MAAILTHDSMKHHAPFLIFIPLLIIGSYLGWSLSNGTLHVSGRTEPIRRADNPREYWYFMRIFLVMFAIIVCVILWAVL